MIASVDSVGEGGWSDLNEMLADECGLRSVVCYPHQTPHVVAFQKTVPFIREILLPGFYDPFLYLIT